MRLQLSKLVYHYFEQSGCKIIQKALTWGWTNYFNILVNPGDLRKFPHGYYLFRPAVSVGEVTRLSLSSFAFILDADSVKTNQQAKYMRQKSFVIVWIHTQIHTHPTEWSIWITKVVSNAHTVKWSVLEELHSAAGRELSPRLKLRSHPTNWNSRTTRPSSLCLQPMRSRSRWRDIGTLDCVWHFAHRFHRLTTLIIYHPSLFHSRLQTFLFCKSFPP